MMKTKSKKGLLLFTSEFPIKLTEPFLVAEFELFKEKFDAILVIPIDLDPIKDFQYNSERVHVFIPEFKFIYPQVFFYSMMWKELWFIFSRWKNGNKLLALKTAVKSCMRSKQIAKQVSAKMNVDVKWYGYSFWTDDAALSLSFLQRENKVVRSVSRAHGFDLYESVHPNNYLPFREFIFTTLNQVLTVSKHGAEYINQNGVSHKKNKAKAIYLGTQVQEKATLKPNQKRLLLISCAVVTPIKRLHLIAEALMTIKDLKIDWVHIGGGAGLNELKKLCSHCPSNISVDFLGQLSHATVLNYYKGVNEIPIFINVSWSEGIPVSIMEAFSFGFPAIATNVGGSSEIIDNNVNGYLIQRDFDKNKLAELIRFFFESSDDDKIKFSLSAQKKQQLFFDQKRNAKETYDCIVNDQTFL